MERLNRLYHIGKMCRSVERVEGEGEGRLLDVGGVILIVNAQKVLGPRV
jgi:hypothetical protein